MGYYATVRYLSGLTWSNIHDIILNGKCLVEYNENSVCFVCVCAYAHRYRYIYICIFWCFYAQTHTHTYTYRERLAIRLLSCVQFFVIPWTVACQASLSMGLSRQEYWSVLPFPSLRHLPGSEIKPTSASLAGRFFTTEPPGKSKERLALNNI